MREVLTPGQLKSRIHEAMANTACLTLAWQLEKVYGIPAPVREHVFYPARGFRLDLAWPEVLLGVDEQGGQRRGGKHNRADGYARDLEKLALLQWQGWAVIWATPELIKHLVASKWIAALYLVRSQRMGVPVPALLARHAGDLQAFTLQPPFCLRARRKPRLTRRADSQVRCRPVKKKVAG